MSSSLKKTIFSIIIFFGLSNQPAHGMKEFDQEHPILSTLTIVAIAELIFIGTLTAYNCHQNPKIPWYINVPLAYQIGNRLTDLSQFINSRILFAQLRNSGLTKEKQVEWCKKQLTAIKKQLLDKEKSITKKIIAKFDFDFTFYKEILLSRWLEFHKKITTTEKIAGAAHDETIDEFTINAIKELLIKYGLNPDCYTITYSNKYEENSSYGFYERALYDLRVTETINFEINIINPPTIAFTPDVYTKMTKTNQYASIAHEITHARLQHPEKQSLLRYFTEQIKGQPDLASVYTDIKKQQKMLATLHEEQAEIFPSIDDYTISSCMRSMRKDGYYPGHLYCEHYNTLSTINELHKIIQWLHTAPEQKPQAYNIPAQHPKFATPVIPNSSFAQQKIQNKRLIKNKLTHKYQLPQLKPLILTHSFGEHK